MLRRRLGGALLCSEPSELNPDGGRGRLRPKFSATWLTHHYFKCYFGHKHTVILVCPMSCPAKCSLGMHVSP